MREFGEVVELVGVAQLAPARVVAILLAPARVAAGRLQVAALVVADPDVGPCRRNGEPADTLERRRIVHALAFRADIGERRSRCLAPQPRLLVA